jgi:hypothetical protein
LRGARATRGRTTRHDSPVLSKRRIGRLCPGGGPSYRDPISFGDSRVEQVRLGQRPPALVDPPDPDPIGPPAGVACVPGLRGSRVVDPARFRIASGLRAAGGRSSGGAATDPRNGVPWVLRRSNEGSTARWERRDRPCACRSAGDRVGSPLHRRTRPAGVGAYAGLQQRVDAARSDAAARARGSGYF